MIRTKSTHTHTHTPGREIENGRANAVSERKKRTVFAFMNLPFGYVGPYQKTKGMSRK